MVLVPNWIDPPKTEPQASPEGSADAGSRKPPPKSASTRLVELALDAGIELYHTPEQAAFADIRLDGRRETYAVRSAGFKRWLSRAFFLAEEKAVGVQALQDALGVLEGKAHFEGEAREAFVRVAGHEGKIYYDLADAEWRVVEIDEHGWRVVTEPPIRFRRTRGLKPLPLPVEGGDVDELRTFVNVAGDNAWRLLIAWILQAMRPRGPYPILCFHGQQGSAKSTLGRIVRNLVDPNSAGLRCEPREARDLVIGAANGWVVAFDNLSFVPPWLSDCLCRLSTGGGFATRELYSDCEETIFDAQRPVLLTGIEDVATRGDLLDRAVLQHLPPVPEEKRLLESELWERFEEARPRIFGALLTALSGAMRELPNVKLARLPRMADFGALGVAVERALGWPDGSFMASYEDNRASANETALESSPVAAALVRFMDSRAGWTGNASELLSELSQIVGEGASRSSAWPKRANGLSGILTRLTPNLRAVGIEVSRGAGRERRIITIRTSAAAPQPEGAEESF
jgi:hypothetical protein